MALLFYFSEHHTRGFIVGKCTGVACPGRLCRCLGILNYYLYNLSTGTTASNECLAYLCDGRFA